MDLLTREKDYENHHQKGNISNIWLKRALVRQFVSWDTLLRQAIVESQVGDLNDNPPNQPCHSSDVDEPPKNDARIIVNHHVDQRTW